MTLLESNNDSSLAVLDNNGGLYGNISMSDIKWIIKLNQFGLLRMPVAQFIRLVRIEQEIADGRV